MQARYNKLLPEVYHTVKKHNLLSVTQTHRGSKGTNRKPIFNIPVRTTERIFTPQQPACSVRRSPTLTVVHQPTPWNLPTILNANVQSLNNKIDELQTVCDINGVDIAVISETFISDQKPIEQYELDGYHKPPPVCCRKDQSRGGVACYIKDHIPYKWWQELTQPGIESLWITMRPKRLPREISNIILGAIYHPPSANNYSMIQHIQTSLETILQQHPGAGILITGDFNQLKCSALTSGFRLKQIVNKPTRGHNILDKILTNMPTLYPPPSIIGNIASSDHDTVLAVPQVTSAWKPPTCSTILTRPVDHQKKCHLGTTLQNVRWEQMYNLNTAEEQYEFFESALNSAIDNCLPRIEKRLYSNDKPWITPAFKTLISQRQKAKLQGNTTLYNTLRNRVNRSRKSLRSDFYKKSLEQINDSKSWWKTVKQLIGLNNRDTTLLGLANDKYNSDEKLLADAINETFAEVSADLDPLKPPEMPINRPVPDKYIIHTHQVEKRLSQIKLKKAIGPDNIPNWILKEYSDILAPPVSAIFNTTLRTANIPSMWLSANICPLAKVKPPTDIKKDLRPISLTPILAKTLESFPVRWIRSECGNVDINQYGAIERSSTTHALLQILHPIFKATDKPKYFARILMIDFSKAFDHIHHQTALNKMKSNGAHTVLVDWFRAFLTKRRQRVKIGKSVSEWKYINGGVPQGTLSGPEIFIHMVSDLQTDLPCIKYVDDTTIVEICQYDEQSQMQSVLDSILEWSVTNQLYLNAKKTKEIVVNFSRKELNIPALTINGSNIERVQSAKLLGVMISENLKWSEHVNYIHPKASKRLYYLRQLKQAGLSQSDLLKVYETLIRPKLEYCCQVWSTGLTMELCSLLESVQERACRIILPWISYSDALNILKIPTVTQRYQTLSLKFFRQMQTDSHRLHSLLPVSKECHYGLRKKCTLPLPICKTERYKKSFIPWCLFHCEKD